MKKQLLLLLGIIYSFQIYAQINFEKGYFINNSGQKIECFIKNADWIDNPKQFRYKPSVEGLEKTLTIEDVQEFSVYNEFKYIRAEVEIDRSGNTINNLNYNIKPSFKKEQLFLKSLIEGEASLYSYYQGKVIRFFYHKKDSKIEQLVYREYLNANNKIQKNNSYRQQLWNQLKCDGITIEKIKKIGYKKRDLVRFFLEYNQCNNSAVEIFKAKKKKGVFNLNARIGINSSSLSTSNSTLAVRSIDFDNEISFRIGAEFEYVFPFNKNKWAFILEATYQSYTSEREMVLNPNTPLERIVTDNVKYNVIQMPIGVRHYLFLKNNSKIFINSSFVMDISSGSSNIDFAQGTSLDIGADISLAFGMGYKKNDKFSLELRYQTANNLTAEFITQSTTYNSFSVIFGYSLF